MFAKMARLLSATRKWKPPTSYPLPTRTRPNLPLPKMITLITLTVLVLSHIVAFFAGAKHAARAALLREAAKAAGQAIRKG